MTTTEEDIQQLHEQIEKESEFVNQVLEEMGTVVVGQHRMLERLLIGLFCNGHILLEGVPGLAKTLAVSTLAAIIDAKFQRVQFTPDLLPADLIGTLIYDQRKGEFSVKKGPIFANIVLADEVNRAPAKVQSAMLEAMQERQVTIGEETFQLDDPFLVLGQVFDTVVEPFAKRMPSVSVVQGDEVVHIRTDSRKRPPYHSPLWSRQRTARLCIQSG